MVGGGGFCPARSCGAGGATPRRRGRARRCAALDRAQRRGRAPSTVLVRAAGALACLGRAAAAGDRARVRSLRGLVYRERLSSGPKATITSVWRAEAPDRPAAIAPPTATRASSSGKTPAWDPVVGGGWKRSVADSAARHAGAALAGRRLRRLLLGAGRLNGRRAGGALDVRAYDPRRGTRSRWSAARCERRASP